ncbi:MAG: gene transfer agent family protein [Alphaproteobacteria bacterium]|nr:gene transfer agent family protein [Alphaproteobacteria bacterium]
MANPLRGEIEAVIGGHKRTLCLTLGALAELEGRLQASDLNGLAERFEGGRVSARDLVAILGAGLRGAGEPVTDDELMAMPIEGGITAAASIAAELLEATFGRPDETP